ncbi:MAG: hypothetical protein ACKVJ6_06745 [Flavobacteriales bacterium]|jgi:hypothetical protein|tara:strand:+ start:149 stop:982 length:834 start_codon:yes stop_codon:yes gene_type:complete
MKKLMFTLAICSLVITSAQAQKQLGGEHNVEVNLTPFGNSPINGTTIKYRNFMDDDAAFRLSLTVGSSNDSYAYYQEGEMLGDPVSPQLNLTSGTTVFGIAPGYEIHFDGTDNLSPYFGIEAYYMMGNRSDKMEFWGPNDLDNVGQPDVYITWDLTNKQSYNSMGLNLLFGADYYFSDAIYVGFEAGLGFGTTSFGNHEIGTSDLTAFNIQFNGAFDPTTAGSAIADSFVGELPFNVVEGEMFYDYYDQGYIAPNQVSNTTIGNVFNGAIRVGFLFD